MKNIFLLLLIPLIHSCSKNPDVRGYTVFNDMAFSPAYEAFSENELTPDGKTMMKAVKGSIARGKMPYPYGNTEDEAYRAEEELVDPYEETEKSLARGEYLYKGFCLPCHGPSGEGDGPVVEKNFPTPPSLKSRAIRNFNKARIFHAITVGAGNMPEHGSQLTIQDRWYLSQYVKKSLLTRQEL